MYLAKVYKCRDAIYHSMNDRGVYLPDDYNADSPPAQVCLQIFNNRCSHRGRTCIKRKKCTMAILIFFVHKNKKNTLVHF